MQNDLRYRTVTTLIQYVLQQKRHRSVTRMNQLCKNVASIRQQIGNDFATKLHRLHNERIVTGIATMRFFCTRCHFVVKSLPICCQIDARFLQSEYILVADL